MQADAPEDDVPGHRPGRFDDVKAIAGRRLTRREAEIVRLVLSGETNRGIATRHGVSEHTVKAQLARLFKKAGVKSRLELALKVLKR